MSGSAGVGDISGNGIGEDVSQGIEFEGYSNYQAVSHRISRSIDQAVDAYSMLAGRHNEDAGVSPEMAAEGRRYLLSAALKLLPELRENRSSRGVFDEILTRWEEDGSHQIETDEDYPPFIEGILNAKLTEDLPDWAYQFVVDIRQAGWEIGYLQAGRSVQTQSDPVEEDVNAMFKGIEL